MTLRRLVPFAVACLFAGAFAFAQTQPAGETKSTSAEPVAEQPGPPTPPDPPTHRGHAGRPDTWGDRGGYGEDVTIEPGETHDGNVVCVHGDARIAGDVNGDVVVVLGTLELSGKVSGDVVTVLSRAELDPKAEVAGNLVNVGPRLRRNGAIISGQVVNVPLPTLGWGDSWGGLGIFAGVFFWWKLFALFLFFVCALLLSALVPDRIRLISEEVPVRVFTAFLAGLVGYMVFGMVQIFLAITIIGLPLVVLLFLVFTILKWLAMCAIFHQVGWRIGRAFGRDMSLLGGILLGLAPFAFIRFLPWCVGWSVWFLVEILGFGFLILTRVGTRRSAAIRPATPPPAPPPIVSPDPIAPTA
jgi:hypothetical protein